MPQAKTILSKEITQHWDQFRYMAMNYKGSYVPYSILLPRDKTFMVLAVFLESQIFVCEFQSVLVFRDFQYISHTVLLKYFYHVNGSSETILRE